MKTSKEQINEIIKYTLGLNKKVIKIHKMFSKMEEKFQTMKEKFRKQIGILKNPNRYCVNGNILCQIK